MVCRAIMIYWREEIDKKGCDHSDQKGAKHERRDPHAEPCCPASPRGRLIFSATPLAAVHATWKLARELQMQMFRAAAPIGKLDLQLIFFCGNRCRASKWLSSGEQLAQRMGGDRLRCRHHTDRGACCGTR